MVRIDQLPEMSISAGDDVLLANSQMQCLYTLVIVM